MRKCPECGYEGSNFSVKYAAPLLYECPLCKSHHTDPNDGSAIRVLSGEEGIKARPEMYSEEDKARIRKQAKEHNNLTKRISEATKNLCPSCGGNPDVDCSCQPWK